MTQTSPKGFCVHYCYNNKKYRTFYWNLDFRCSFYFIFKRQCRKGQVLVTLWFKINKKISGVWLVIIKIFVWCTWSRFMSHLYDHTQVLHVVLLRLNHLVDHKPKNRYKHIKQSSYLYFFKTYPHFMSCESYIRPLSALFLCSVSDSLEPWSESKAWRKTNSSDAICKNLYCS